MTGGQENSEHIMNVAPHGFGRIIANVYITERAIGFASFEHNR
jgi:hypothetical protein